jgi:hypothetical protein
MNGYLFMAGLVAGAAAVFGCAVIYNVIGDWCWHRRLSRLAREERGDR